jgi:hypothetical protein
MIALDSRSRRVASLALAVCVLDIVLAIAGAALALMLTADADYVTFQSADLMAGNIMIGLAFALVGGLIAVKRPRNVIGWALVLAGLGGLAYDFGLHYGELALLARPDLGLPGGLVVAATTSGSWTMLVTGIFLLLLLFPSGSLPSRRWVYPARAVPALMAITWLAVMFLPRLEEPFREFDNPLAFTDTNYDIVTVPIIAFCLFCMCAAGVHLIVRFWRSEGDEREQYKWLAFAAALFVVSFPLAEINAVLETISGIAFLALPIAVGIAVLRYRLYDIDILISRTLVYAPLTAILAGLFVASTTLIRTIFTDLTDAGSDLAIAVSTLVVVALLTPLKNRLQAFVDRHFKEPPDALANLKKLAAQAETVVEVLDAELFGQRVVQEVVTSSQADGAALEVTAGERQFRIDAGEPNGERPIMLVLAHRGIEVGRLWIWPRQGASAVDKDLRDEAQRAAALVATMIRLAPLQAEPLPAALTEQAVAPSA